MLPGSEERKKRGAALGTHAASSNSGWPGSGEDRLDTRYFNRANGVLSRDQPDRIGTGHIGKFGKQLTPAGGIGMSVLSIGMLTAASVIKDGLHRLGGQTKCADNNSNRGR